METLPVEILHRIFDHLDAETILFSIRSVSRLFQSVVNIYDRYILNMRLIAKLNFNLFCRLLHPSKILSLTLSNDKQIPNQISLFISSVHLQEFTRLRSLTLLSVKQDQFNHILKHIHLTNLISFSFSIKEYDKTCIETSANILLSVIEKPNLRKLEVDTNDKLLTKILWTINCTIHQLTINDHIDINELHKILQCCPHLHTLIAKSIYGELSDRISQTCFHQLISLTIEEFDETMNELEPFLLSTSSLVYLKLIARNQMMNGQRWEEFIQIHLPYLNKFEFFFEHWDCVERSPTDIQLIINSFQTPFWLEQKKWFVACDYRIKGSHIYLYSIPICKSYLKYKPKYTNNLTYTWYMTVQENSIMMNNIKSLKLYLDKVLVDDIQEKKKAMIKSPVFPNVTQIELEINHSWSLQLLESLPMYINISQISRIIWNGEQYDNYRKKILIDLVIFLGQAENLSLFFIQNCYKETSKNIDKICSFMPYHVKHLQIPLINFKQLKTILQRCKTLITIKLDCKDLSFAEEVIRWISDNTIHSTCDSNGRQITIWLGKINIQSIEINREN